MARPRKKEAEKLTRRLPHVRCTEGEYARIVSRAAQAGLTQSEYVRRMALDGEVVIRQSTSDFEVANQLRRIGVNINQAMRSFHQSDREVPEIVGRVYAKLETLLDQILDGAARRS